MKLSNNFTLKELIRSEKARQLNINNSPLAEEKEKLMYLCQYILQPIRDKFGRVNVTSGFRCEELNKAIKGAKYSQHRHGEAADIRIPGVDLKQVFEWIKGNLQFGQAIYEAPEDRDPWIHISLPRLNKLNNQTLLWDGKNYKGV